MSTAVIKHQYDIKIASEDVKIRDILVVSPDRILLCNESKSKVQLVDTKDGRVLSEVSGPYWIKKL